MTIRVLHVIPSDERRGAEHFAADLIRVTNGTGVSHRVVALRKAPAPTVRYDAPTIFLRSSREWLPGMRVDLGRIRSIGALIREWDPDVIQAHGSEALKHTVVGGARRPIVFRVIGSALPRITRGMPRIAYGAIMRRAGRVVAVAESLRMETIKTFRLEPKRVVTIPGGVDSGRLHPTGSREAVRKALGVPATGRVILSLGALSWEKDPLTHLRATARVLQEIPDAVHVFAGEGPLRGEVEAAVRSSGLVGRILVLGNRSDVADLLVASDVMLLASRMEGLPGCLIEAGMAGLPVVAYSVGGVPEVVVDEKTGLLVAPGDGEGLTESMLLLLRNDAARRDMGEAARERCAAFDIDVVADRYLELYREVTRSS